MANIVKMAQTAGTLSGRGRAPAANRAYKDGSLRPQYLANETQAYIQEMGQYASNVFAADCQGLNPDDFFEWKRVQLRSVRAAQAQTGSTMPGDWQRIHIINPANYTYLPQGAMLKYADNTWIVFKDKNIAAFQGQAIVRRCNAVVNLLDWYGNIVSLPISYAKMETLGNAPHTTENTITSKNYIACICQLNEYSEKFTENTRIILGKTAYAMRGLDDFTREFTDDPDSAHLLTFTIERVELQSYDSAEYGVADYYGFSWEIEVDFKNSMLDGTTQKLSPLSRRNGVAVTDSDEHPISYYYESSDETVLTVDDYGVVTAVGEGKATITVFLDQNEDKFATVEIEVPAAEEEYVAFTTTLPKYLHEGNSLTVKAAHFVASEDAGDNIDFSFSGALPGAYTITPANEPNTFLLTAYHAAPSPLRIVAECGGYSAEEEIYLIT